MNLILLFEEDLIAKDKARLTGRRFLHIKEILKAKAGQELVVGKVNGLISQGKVLSLGKDSVDIEIEQLGQKPPAASRITLIMALPRPPMLRRTLQCVSSLGIKTIIILNFSKVEKSLWQSSSLRPQAIQEDLVLGLEQAKDTVLPQVILQNRFKPFVEDQLPQLVKGKKAIVAHPGVGSDLKSFLCNEEVVVIIGPEGGLLDFEVDLLCLKGVKPVNLGQRILRFEHVIPYIVGCLSV